MNWHHPIVSCAVCQARPRQPCRDNDGEVMSQYHVARQLADARARVNRAASEIVR